MQDISPQSVKQRTYTITKELLFIIFSKFKIFTVIYLAIFVPVLLYAFLSPSYYRSSGKFTITVPQQLDPLRKETFYDYQARAERLLQDQKEIVFSERVLRKAISQFSPQISEEEVRKAMDKIRKNLSVTPPRGANFKESSVFYISYIDTDPRKSAEIANAICNAYLEGYNEITKENSAFSYSFFKEQTERLYQEMIEAEKKLRDYEKENSEDLVGLLNLDAARGTNLEVGPSALLTQFTGRYYELQEKLSGLRVTIEALENEYNNNSNPAIPKDMQVVGHAITTFKNKVAQLEIQVNELRSQFTEQFPALKQTEREIKLNINSLREELARSIRAQKITAEGISAQIVELERVIEALKDRIKRTASKRATYEQLRQQYQLAKDTYVKARDQLEQARIASSLNQAYQALTYVDAPNVPLEPFKPNRPVVTALGFFAGLLFATAFVVTMDFLDHSIKRPEDLETRVGATFLTSIPRVT